MKKTYAINWENGEVSSVEVNGVQYESPEQITDPEERAAVLCLILNKNDYDEDFKGEFDEFDQNIQLELGSLGSRSGFIPKMLAAIFLSIALIMFGISAISTVSNMRTLAREKSAPGRVVDIVVRGEWVVTKDQAGRETRSQQTSYYPVVEFQLPDDSRQTVQLSEGSVSPIYMKDEAVTILYDPEYLETTRVDSLGSTILLWLVPTITGLLGLSFCGASLMVIWLYKPSQSEKTLNF
jgi:hypothetical protein